MKFQYLLVNRCHTKGLHLSLNDLLKFSKSYSSKFASPYQYFVQFVYLLFCLYDLPLNVYTKCPILNITLSDIFLISRDNVIKLRKISFENG